MMARFYYNKQRDLQQPLLLKRKSERLLLGKILQDLQQSAFGVFLFVAILPAFIPIPGVGGAVSGPLILLIGGRADGGVITQG